MMNHRCGEVFDMEKEAIYSGKLRMIGNSKNCWITVRAPVGRKLVAVFVDMEFHVVDDCDDYIMLTDGSTNGSAMTASICSKKVPKMTEVTSDREMTISYHGASLGSPGSFELLFTAVYEGPCNPPDFKCDNNYCINSTIRCNGYNNCGDNSDCEREGEKESDLKYWLIVGVGIAVVIGVTGYSYIRRRRQRQQQLIAKPADPQSMPLTTVPGQNYPPANAPPYPSGYTTQYSAPVGFQPPPQGFTQGTGLQPASGGSYQPPTQPPQGTQPPPYADVTKQSI